jgi:hypothetical protein
MAARRSSPASTPVSGDDAVRVHIKRLIALCAYSAGYSGEFRI